MIGRRSVLKNIAVGALAGPFSSSGMASFRGPASGGQAVRLDSNENAYGPSPHAVAAIQALAPSANRFPRGAELLRESLAEHLEMPSDQILLGAGIDEILRMSVAA